LLCLSFLLNKLFETDEYKDKTLFFVRVRQCHRWLDIHTLVRAQQLFSMVSRQQCPWHVLFVYFSIDRNLSNLYTKLVARRIDDVNRVRSSFVCLHAFSSSSLVSCLMTIIVDIHRIIQRNKRLLSQKVVFIDESDSLIHCQLRETTFERISWTSSSSLIDNCFTTDTNVHKYLFEWTSSSLFSSSLTNERHVWRLLMDLKRITRTRRRKSRN
jgi:hypothetical protein